MNQTPYEGVMTFGSFRIKFKIQTARFQIQNSKTGSNWAGPENSRPGTRSTMVSTWSPQVDHRVDLGVDLPVDLPGRPGWLGLALARISMARCVIMADMSPLDWLFELCMI